MDSVVLGAVGVQIVLATGQDLTEATKLEIHAVKPDGTTVTWVATASPTAGSIQYTTITGDLVSAGSYYLHSYVEWGSASVHTGQAVLLEVLPAPPAWSPIEAVKLELGKGTSVDLLADNEIAYFVSRANGNILLAASFAAESLSGYYADLVDKSMGGSSVSLSQKAEAWRKKAAALKAQATNPSLTPRFTASAPPATLKFGLGQHDNPGLSSSTIVGDETW